MSEPPRTTGWEGAEQWFASVGRRHPGAEGEPRRRPAAAVRGLQRRARRRPDLLPRVRLAHAPGSASAAPKTAYILAAAMVVLGLGAGALAYAVAKDDDDGVVDRSTRTAPSDAEHRHDAGRPAAARDRADHRTLPPDTTFTAPIDTSGTTDDTSTGFDTVTGPSPTGSSTGDTQPARHPRTDHHGRHHRHTSVGRLGLAGGHHRLDRGALVAEAPSRPPRPPRPSSRDRARRPGCSSRPTSRTCGRATTSSSRAPTTAAERRRRAGDQAPAAVPRGLRAAASAADPRPDVGAIAGHDQHHAAGRGRRTEHEAPVRRRRASA